MKNLFVAVSLLLTGMLNAQWDTLNTGTDIRFNAIAADETQGIVTVGIMQTDSGAYGAKFLSGDNGDTWNALPPVGNEANIEFHDVDFTSNGYAWIVGDSGQVICQTLWFWTFTCDRSITSYSLRAGFPVNDSAFYCGGENGNLFRTFDRGVTWDTLVSGTGETINDIYFTDAANGWIIADGGYLAATADSGSTWTFVPQPNFGFIDYNGFAYQDTSGTYPYLVGETGTGLFSVDGGFNWYNFSTGTTLELNSIRFMNIMSGVICGNNGYILRSVDGGGYWFNDQCPGVGADLFGVAFMSDTMAFVCGDSGVVLRSNTDISSVHGTPIARLGASIYPNPASAFVYVQILTQEQTAVTIEMIDATGRSIEVNYYENVSAGENRFEIGTEQLSPGFYFIRVMAGESVLTLPLLKQ